MNSSKSLTILLVAIVCAFGNNRALGGTVGSGSDRIKIELVTVGNPGNPPDTEVMYPDRTTGYGSVPYAFHMGKYEVTNAQYVKFLNAVDPTGTNTLGLYHRLMTIEPRGGISFNDIVANGSKYEIKPGRGNNPVVFVSWYSTVRFANWLHNGQGSGGTEVGAYTLLGGTPTPSNGDSIVRNSDARWWLPSENEWYKAAYHKNSGPTGDYWDYPTSTDVVPYSDQPPGSEPLIQSNTANYWVDDLLENGYNDGYAVPGSPEYDPSVNYLTDVGAYKYSSGPYGTFDQAGNVWEWIETLAFGKSGTRGGSWGGIPIGVRSSTRSFGLVATDRSALTGFRVAGMIPEPSTLLLAALFGLATLFSNRVR